mgnify:FL=1
MCSSDLGARLGFTGGARVEAALRQRLANSGATATLMTFPSLAAAGDALRLGELDGLVIEADGVDALRQRLANRGIETALLDAPVLVANRQVLLSINQSRLRDALQTLAEQG